MISVVILDNNEPKVIEMTYENLYNELRYIPDSKVIVADDWFAALNEIKTPYVCFVEPDCLVHPGYFSDLLGVFKDNKMYRTLAMVTSATGIQRWENKIYGYALGNEYLDSVIPVRLKVSSKPYQVPVAYFPGSLIRTKTLQKVLKKLEINPTWSKDLVFLSTKISEAMWGDKAGKGSPYNQGNAIYINPDTTYVTTEDYIGLIAKFEV